jgi:hypothetical protein
MPGVRAEIQDDIVEVLEHCGRFADHADRLALVDRVSHRRGVALAVVSVPHERTHLQFLVRACTAEDCLADLIETIQAELDEQARWRLLQLNDEWDGVAHFSDHDWLEIKKTLLQVDVTNGNALFHAVQRRYPPPMHCRSVWHLFAYLAGSNGDDQGVPLFMIFLHMVAYQVESRLNRPLRTLLNRLASDWDITGSFQRAALRHLRAIGSGERVAAALLILIDPHPMVPDTYTVTHWYGWRDDRAVLVNGGDRVVPRDRLESAVQHIVQDTEDRWPIDDRPLRIEFILPFELLNLPVEHWPKEYDPQDGPVPLYEHYPVVVRSLDRIRNRGRHRVWRSRWRTLEESPTLVNCQFAEDVHPRLEQTINLDRRIVAVVLSEPPVSQSSAGMSEIRIAIRTGIPIIIWHRSPHPGVEFRLAVDELFAYGEIAEVPDRVFELRLRPPLSDDSRSGSGTGPDLVLLWDDPIRLPEKYGVAGASHE